MMVLLHIAEELPQTKPIVKRKSAPATIGVGPNIWTGCRFDGIVSRLPPIQE